MSDEFLYHLSRIEKDSIDITPNHDAWWKLSIAIATEFGENGRSYFHRLCRFWPRYKYRECNAQYSYALKRCDEYKYFNMNWLLKRMREA